MHLAYGTLAAVWCCASAARLWDGPVSGRALVMLLIWVAAVPTLLLRAWWGGPRAWVFVEYFAQVLGTLVLVALVITLVVAVRVYVASPKYPYFAAGFAGGALLYAAGRLLASETVRAWYGDASVASPSRRG
jgi:hypothetical protein